MCFVNPCNVCGLCAGGGGGCNGARGGAEDQRGGPAAHGATKHQQGHANKPQPLCAAGTPSSPPDLHRGSGKGFCWGSAALETCVCPLHSGGGGEGGWSRDHPPGFPPSPLWGRGPGSAEHRSPRAACAPPGPGRRRYLPDGCGVGTGCGTPPPPSRPPLCTLQVAEQAQAPPRSRSRAPSAPSPKAPGWHWGSAPLSPQPGRGAPSLAIAFPPCPKPLPASGPDGGSRSVGQPGPLPSPSLPQPAQPPRATPAATPVCPPPCWGSRGRGVFAAAAGFTPQDEAGGSRAGGTAGASAHLAPWHPPPRVRRAFSCPSSKAPLRRGYFSPPRPAVLQQ